MFRKLFSIALLIVGIPFSASAVTIQISGTMDTGDTLSGISAGDLFSGSITVDTSIGHEPGGTLFERTYPAITGFSFSIGSWAATAGSPTGIRGVRVTNYSPSSPAPPDQLSYFASELEGGLTAPFLPGGSKVDLIELMFTDHTNLALSSITIPETLTLSDWGFATVDFHFSDINGNSGFVFDGTVTSLSVVPDPPPPGLVPLPASALFVLSGVFGLMLVRRRR